MTDPRDDPAADLEQALAAYLADQRMTRRQLLERIAAMGAAAALAPVIVAAGGAANQPGAPSAAAPAGRLAVAPVPAQAATASSHVIARILARIVARG